MIASMAINPPLFFILHSSFFILEGNGLSAFYQLHFFYFTYRRRLVGESWQNNLFIVRIYDSCIYVSSLTSVYDLFIAPNMEWSCTVNGLFVNIYPGRPMSRHICRASSSMLPRPCCVILSSRQPFRDTFCIRRVMISSALR